MNARMAAWTVVFFLTLPAAGCKTMLTVDLLCCCLNPMGAID